LRTRKPAAALPGGAAALPQQQVDRGTPQAAAAGLSRWFEEHCRDSAISRSTETYNRVLRGVRDVQSALHALAQEQKD
jgi:hypothetical protein